MFQWPLVLKLQLKLLNSYFITVDLHNFVFFPVKPLEKPVTTFYQIQPGSDYDVKFNFSANPEPTNMEWRYGSSLDNPEGSISIPGIQDRYSADIEVRTSVLDQAFLREYLW